MNWIGYSFLMFFSSIALYLLVRKSALVKIPTHLTNLAMFAIPLVASVGLGLRPGEQFNLSVWQAVVILVASVVFAYGGNTASLRAISMAPNPGYSLVLSKSYVLFTTLVAVFLLNAELSLHKALAIVLIVGFSALIMVSPKGSEHKRDNSWIVLSFAAFFAWGMLSLSSKYLFSHGVSTIAFLVYLYAIVTVCIVTANKLKLDSFKKINARDWLLLLGTGASATFFNSGQFEAIRLAPNVGYVNAMNAASISLVTIFAVILFKDELSWRKAVGIAGVTAGLILLLV